MRREAGAVLSVILGRLELLARRFADDEAALAAVEKASLAGRRINEIIAYMNRMTRLTVTRMSAGLPELFDLERSSDTPDIEPLPRLAAPERAELRPRAPVLATARRPCRRPVRGRRRAARAAPPSRRAHAVHCRGPSSA